MSNPKTAGSARAALDSFLPTYLDNDPEMLTTLGLSRTGLAADLGGDLTIRTDAFVADRVSRADRYRQILQSTKQPADTDQVQSSQVLDWYLNRVVEGGDFALLSYPVLDRGDLSDLYLSGEPFQTLGFLMQGHPLTSRQDVLDFVSRVQQLQTKLDAVSEAMDRRLQEGLPTPLPILRAAIRRINGLLIGPPRQFCLVRRLEQDVHAAAHISEPECRQLVEMVGQIVESSVRTGLRHLLDACDRQMSSAPHTCSLAMRPKGEAFYRHLIRQYVGVNTQPAELLRLGWKEIERVGWAMAEALSRLGVRAHGVPGVLDAWQTALGSEPDLFATPVTSGENRRSDVDEAITTWIRTARDRTRQTLGGKPWPIEVVPTPDLFEEFEPEGSYQPPSAVSDRPAIFHLNRRRAPTKAAALKTLVFHETIPGHHYQTTELLARQPPHPSFRAALPLPGWSEGWATQAEDLAAEMGLYEGDPMGDIGRLEATLRRAVRLVLDVGVHGEGWTDAEARQHIETAIGMPAWFGDELARVQTHPARGSAYTVGKHVFGRLRDRVSTTDDLPTFAARVLRCGPCPLELLEDLYLGAEPASVGRPPAHWSAL